MDDVDPFVLSPFILLFFLYGLLMLVIILNISDVSANKCGFRGIVNIKLLLIKECILLMSHMQKQETDFRVWSEFLP